MTMSIGLIVSIISSENVNKLDPTLVAPFLRKFLKTDNSIELHQVQVCLNINFSFNTNLIIFSFIINVQLIN